MAEKVEIKNKNGVVRMVTQKYEGLIWPFVVEDPVQRVHDTWNFRYKDGDLFVCSYPRTGSNWMLDMLAMLRSNNTEINVAMTPPVEVFPAATLNRPSPRTMLTHLPFRLMPRQHVKQGGKIILMHRNPKDTVVSTYHFSKKNKGAPYEGDFEEFLHYFTTGEIMFNGYIEYFKEWDRILKENPDLPVLIVRYEDLKRDCLSQLRRVCDFLKIDRGSAFLQEVVEKNDVNKVKSAKEANPDVQEFIKMTATDDTLHFYRKGIVGDWKNVFTVAQSEKFDEVFREQLKHTIFGYN